MATQTQRFLQGEIVDTKFTIGQYLGGSEHSSVFVTQIGELRPRDAAIKLVAAPPGAAEAQLSRWRVASNFSHPHLVQVLEMGRCELDNKAMLYVVTELASENLAEILPERPLTPDETRDMLGDVVDVLAFIHSRGFVHGHIKPSNIMAVGEDLKLSSDGICRLGEEIENSGSASKYEPPEGWRNGASPAGDIWSLGITLCEVLTQQLPQWSPSDRKDPVLPEALPASFVEVVRHCLRREPKNRWSAAAIAAHLPRTTSPAPAHPAVAPAAPAAAAAYASTANAARAKAAPAVRAAMESETSGKRGYFIGAAALAVLLVLVFAGSKLVDRHVDGQVPQTATPGNVTQQPDAKPTQPPAAATEPVHPQTAPPAHLAATKPTPLASSKRPPAQPAPSHSSAPALLAAKPASVPPKPAADVAPKSVASSPATASTHGSVLREALPNVPQSASDTIHGTVRVAVRVKVDPSGNVSDAQIDSAGPSRYFANISLETARKWKFVAAKLGETSVPSIWILHFNYTKAGTTIQPSRLSPNRGR
jgi:TonB family protein